MKKPKFACFPAYFELDCNYAIICCSFVVLSATQTKQREDHITGLVRTQERS